MQLIFPLILLLLVSGVAKLFAANKVSTSMMYYTDRSNVDITEEMILYQHDVSPKTQLSMQLGLDSVSSASFDTTSQASSVAALSTDQNHLSTTDDDDDEDHDDDEHGEGGEGSTTKFRFSGSFGVTHSWTEWFKTNTVVLGSTKSDYQSYTVGQSADFQVTSRLGFSLGAYYTSNTIQPEIATDNVYDQPPSDTLSNDRISGLTSLSYILSPTRKVKAIVEYFESNGYQSTGYQRVPVTDDVTSEILENLPNARSGTAVTGIYSQWIDPNKALHLRMRYYEDSYKIKALSGDVSLPFYVSEGTVLTPRYRYYHQNAASFWMEESEKIPTGYYTNQYALGDITAHQIGLGFSRDFELNKMWNMDFLVGTWNLNYDYYWATSGFYFHSVSFGVSFEF